MWVSFFRTLNKSLGTKIITVFILFLFIYSSSIIVFFIFHQSNSLTKDTIKNGLLLSEMLADTSRIGLFAENREMLKNAVEKISGQKEIIEISVYSKDGLLLEQRQTKDSVALKQSYEKKPVDKNEVFKKISSSFLSVSFSGKNAFEFFSPVMTSAINPDKAKNLFLDEKSFIEKTDIIGFTYLKVNRQKLKQQINMLVLKSLSLFFLFFLLGSIAVFYIVRSITRPLNRLTGAVNALEQGKDLGKVRITTRDEIGKLAVAFNRMSDTIKKREEDLEEVSNRLFMAFEAANEGLWDFNVKTSKSYFIPRWYTMLGYEPYEMPVTLEIFLGLIHPDDRAMMIKAGQDFMADNKQFFNYEFRLKSKNSGYKWIMARGKSVETDSSGKPIRVVGTHVDITDLKEAEKQIQALSLEILTAQECERQKIARELHDNIAQNLSSLKIATQTLFDGETVVPLEVKGKISDITMLLHECIKEVRTMSYDLRPPELDQLSMVKTVLKFCDDFSKREAIKIDVKAAGIDENLMDAEMEINIYRIIQEALNNIKRHAEATRVIIRLISSFPDIVIRIEDNGKGFDVKVRKASAIEEKRMGLVNLNERVRLLNGEISLQSQKNKGTKIYITIPYKEEKTCQKIKVL